MPAITCPKGVYGAIPENDVCNDCEYLRMTRSMRFVCDWEPQAVKTPEKTCETCKHATITSSVVYCACEGETVKNRSCPLWVLDDWQYNYIDPC